MKKRLICFFAGMLLLTATRLMAETYGNWPYYKDFLINTTSTGANVASNQIKFPLLIRLSAADSVVFNQAQASGTDIRFSGVTSSGAIGTHFPYQREQWDRTNRTAAFWVLVDTLKGNISTQKIRIFWGSSTTADSSNSSVVFDRQNGFQGVWHFGEGNNSTANDATANGYNGTASGTTPPADTAGIIGRCRKFDGATSYFALNGTAGGNLNFPEAGTYTLSAWVNTDALTSSNHEIISKGDHQYALKVSEGNLWLFTEFSSTAGWQSVSTPAAAGSWHHVVGVRNGANEVLYVDGLLASNTINTYYGTGRSTALDVNIGKWPDNADRFFDGKIDEVEMSNVSRSADWIKLCYQNQKSGSTMISAAPIIVPPASLKYTPNPATYFTGVAVTNTPTYTSVVDSFTISSSSTLPAGLNINKLTGSIYGTPTAAKAQTSYLVTARNAAGFDTETVVITVNGPPSNLNYGSDTFSYTVNTAIPANTPVFTGVVDSFTVDSLPSGLQIAKATGIISGTPIAVTPARNYTITARNQAGTATVKLNITITAAQTAPSNLHYRTRTLPCVVGTAITPDTPTVTGTVTSWAINPSLITSTGLTFNTANGIISGTPTTATSGQIKFVITAANSAGSTTDTVSITITPAVVPPSISAQSGNVWAGVNSAAARVWVKAAGTTPLAYQWSKNGTALAAGTKDTLKLDTVRRADNNSIYVCSVSNSADTVSSVPCTLHVVMANFSAKPAAGNDTLTVAFSDSSLGASAGFPLTYAWSFGDGATSSQQNPSHFYSKPTTYSAKLIVTANGVSDSMKKTITLSPLTLKAVFTADTTTAPLSLTVTFTDLSTGTVYTRFWSFGDGTSRLDSSRAAVTHTYTKVGNYLPMLTVRGPAGADSAALPSGYIIIYNPDSFANTIRITGQYSANKTVAVAFSGYSGLSDASQPLYVNKIELWSKKNALPSAADTVGASPIKTYTLSQMKAAGNQFSDVIQLTGTYSATDSLGLMSDILWNNGTRSPFSPANGTYVSLRDTAQPANPLLISGIYAGGTLADIYLDNVSGLDTAKDAYVKIQYDFIDTTFSSNLGQQIPVSTVLAQAKNNRYTYELSNSLFAGATRPLYCGVSIIGVNNVLSQRKSTSFTVGGNRPNNPIHLQASKLSAGSIQLQWTTAPTVANIDSMRIWYSGQQPVPLSFSISTADFLEKYVSITADSVIISGLDPNTEYYFGAQVDSGNLWSYVTDSSSDSAKTDTASGPPMQNIIHLDTAYFDTSTNSIKAVISTDTTGHYGDTLKAGMSWSTDLTAIDTGSQPPQNPRKTIRPLDTLTAALGDQVQFDTLYYVGMWLRNQNTGWAKPISGSKGSLITPAFTWQTVSYGGKFPIVYVDNKTFRIRIDTAAYPGISDDNKIIRWQPSEAPVGFIPVSIGFEFGKPITPPPLSIGINYGVLPSGYSPSDVRIYRYDNGLWFLDRSPLSYDNGYVSITTQKIGDPFIAMIDTMPPLVKILSKSTDSVAALLDVDDTFAISDNIANVTWSFQSAKGGDAYDPAVLTADTLKSYTATVATIIEAGLVSADQGVRAILTASDGRNDTTVNVSRRVIRQTASDVMATGVMKWVPLRVTARLDKPGAKDALRALSADSVWKYDKTKFRLFRWYSYSGNAMNDTNKWVEYADSTDSLFSFVPGRVAWVKTRESKPINFGMGLTLDLTRPDTISLQPDTWTDFAIPFKFDIQLGDILDATNDSVDIMDSLIFIFWQRISDTASYKDSLLHFGLLDNGWGPTTTLRTLQNGSIGAAYSIFNPRAIPVKLVVPPLPVALSKYTAQGQSKKTGIKAWVLKVSGRTQNGTFLSSVYCGYKQGNPSRRYYPAAPALGEGANIRFCDEKKSMFGYIVQSGMLDKEGGVEYDLAFNNVSDKAEQINYTVEAINGLPPKMRTALFDPSNGAMVDAKGTLMVAVSPGGTVHRQLLMGDEKFLAKVKLNWSIMRLAFVSAYPNPFKRTMRIRFSLPQSGLSSVHFGIFNASGREVWNTYIACSGKSGLQEVAWDGNTKSKAPAASGMYIVRMTALNLKGARAGVFEKKIMYLP